MHAHLQKPLLTRAEVAEVLDVSVQTVARMIGRGELEKVPVGDRFVRIPTESLMAYLARYGQEHPGSDVAAEEPKRLAEEEDHEETGLLPAPPHALRDLRACLAQRQDDIAEALDLHATMLSIEAEGLHRLADRIRESGRAAEFSVVARDGARVRVTGPRELVEQFLDDGLLLEC
jgi:excisionase family DNA binding protein